MLSERINNSEKIIEIIGTRQDRIMISDSDRLAITIVQNQIAIMKALRNIRGKLRCYQESQEKEKSN